MSSHNVKGALLRCGECGFAVANLRPLISDFLVRYGEGGLRSGEGGLRSGEVLHHDEGGLRSDKVLRRNEGGLQSGEPVTLCDDVFSSFLLMLYFSVF